MTTELSIMLKAGLALDNALRVLIDMAYKDSMRELLTGVLEAVTVYRNEDGQYVLLRGQRRTVTAAEVGTPTGLIPARVVHFRVFSLNHHHDEAISRAAERTLDDREGTTRTNL